MESEMLIESVVLGVPDNILGQKACRPGRPKEMNAVRKKS